MTLAALIRKKATVRFATATPATVATLEVEKARTVASVATVSVAKSPKAKTEMASRWWLVHYPNGAPVEVWTSPPATQAEVLQSRPDAIAAQPFHQSAPEPQPFHQAAPEPQPLHQATPEPITDCSTCTHATYRGGCGEPVAAGLSAQEGVICYHGNGGKDCPAWLATALAGARSDPADSCAWWKLTKTKGE